MKPTLELTERFIEGLEKHNLTLEEIQSGDWKYCGGNGEQRHKNYFKLIFENDDYPDPDDHCICGHYIVENCYIYKHNIDDILILGNCCIKKFVPKSGRTCSICDKPHKNRKDNLCNNCRKTNLKTETLDIDKILMSKQQKSFTVNGNTLIGWGKLKGKPHSSFLKKENENYKNWVLNQGSEFRYNSSRNWIICNEDENEEEYEDISKFKIVSNTDEEKFNEILTKVKAILDSDEYKGLTFFSN